LKFKYIKENDILIIVLSHGKIEHVEHAGPINIHFSIDKKPILIEILDATNFLKKALDFTKKAEEYKRLKSQI
jgi:uncharacterized protein YuzE